MSNARDDLLLSYGDLTPELAASQRLGSPAGIFLLEGRFHVANRASGAERALLEAGALLVASLLFDARQAERAASGGAPNPRAAAGEVVPLLNREAVAAIRPSPSES